MTYKVRYKLDGHTASSTFPTLPLAKRFSGLLDRWGPARAREMCGITAPKPRPSGGTVSECVEGYISLRPNRGTREEYTSWARSSIQPTIGAVALDQLTHEDVQRWVNAQTGASKTIARNHSLLSSSLKSAVLRGEIPSNPALGVKIPRMPQNTARAALTPVYTRDECDLIVEAMDPDYELLTRFLIESGCRFGEASALTPADINIDAGKVTFNKSYSYHKGSGYTVGTTKSVESERTIRVDGDLLSQLRLDGELVFTTPRGTAVKDNSFRATQWKRALRDSGLPTSRHGHPHDLRHAHATWLLESGISLPAIQKRLGHADVMTTLRMYGHPATDSEDRIMAALGRDTRAAS